MSTILTALFGCNYQLHRSNTQHTCQLVQQGMLLPTLATRHWLPHIPRRRGCTARCVRRRKAPPHCLRSTSTPQTYCPKNRGVAAPDDADVKYKHNTTPVFPKEEGRAHEMLHSKLSPIPYRPFSNLID